MSLTKYFAVLLVAVLFSGIFSITGCAHKKPGSDAINHQIRVFNISLFAPAHQGPLEGAKPRREPCIGGYEFYYDDLDVVVSHKHNDSVWRITTRNPKTSMFGITPGDSFLQSKARLAKLGFSQGYTPYKFVKDWCQITLLVNEKNDVFGMTVEVRD